MASNKEDLVSLLQEYLSNPTNSTNPNIILARADAITARPQTEVSERYTAQNVVFAFCGMGPQWYAMGRQLSHSSPTFLATLTRIDNYLQALGGESLLKELLLSDSSSSRINEAAFAQPGIFAIQMGLLELWRSWGVRPSVVVGHSFGEIAAACAAGAFTLEQATTIVYHRSRLLQTMRGSGTMLATAISEAKAREIQLSSRGTIVVAARNSPSRYNQFAACEFVT